MYFGLIAVGTFILDQITKWLVQVKMEPGQSIPLIDKVFHLTYVENHGAAFGILAYQTTFFVIITFVVLLAMGFFYKKLPPHKRFLKAGLALQAGGAVGNLVDRVIYGHVIDFFDFRVWPVFNVADMAIVAGVGMLLWEIMKNEKVDENREKKSNNTGSVGGENYDSH